MTGTSLGTSPYRSYVYAYPHKTAYRPLAGHPGGRPLLGDLWAAERKDALSLYLHIPFCEVRCGFCNLFTRIGAPEELTTRYLDALDRQATASGTRWATTDRCASPPRRSVAERRPSSLPVSWSVSVTSPRSGWAPT